MLTIEEIKCKNCGQPLDPTKEIQTCNYCGTSYQIQGNTIPYGLDPQYDNLRKNTTLKAVCDGADIDFTELNKEIKRELRRGHPKFLTTFNFGLIFILMVCFLYLINSPTISQVFTPRLNDSMSSKGLDFGFLTIFILILITFIGNSLNYYFKFGKYR